MKKLFLTLTFLLGFLGMSAAEQVVAELQFGKDYWPGVSAYNKTTISNDKSWTIVNFNNNNNSTNANWAGQIKCGTSTASIAEIIYNKPVTVDKIKLSISAIGAPSKVNSIKLVRASDANFTDAEDIHSFNIDASPQEYLISEPIADQYYKVVFDLQSGSNGFVAVSGFTLSADDGKGEDTRTPVTLSFGDDTEGTVTLGDTFTLPELAVDPAAAKSVVTYSSDNEAVATINATTGAVTIVGIGTAVFTASFDGNDEYLPAAPVTFTLKVLPALSDNELYIEFKLANSDPSTALPSSSSNVSTFVTEGADNISSYTSSYAYSPSQNGLKLSSSKKDGSFTITLAKSYLITGITVEAASYGSDAASLEINGETFKPNGTTLENYQLTYAPTAPTDEISISATKRAYVHALTIYFEPEPEPTEVAALTITPQFGSIYTGDEIVIACETEGALLYGKIGDTVIEGEEMPYTYTVSEELADKTINVSLQGKKDGLTDSAELDGEFTVAARPTLVSNNATFNWTSSENFTDESLSSGASVDNKTFTKDVISVTYSRGTGSAPVYNGLIRFYANNTVTIKLNSIVGHLDNIVFDYASGYLPATNKFTANCGTISPDGKTWTAEVSRADADDIREVTFTNTNTSQVRINTTSVAYTDVPTGIEAVEAAESDAPAVFYNLQGIRVNNPSGGIFIRVQGNNVDKILVK